MQFTIFAITAFAATAFALPQLNGDAGIRSNGVASCAANHATSCCDVKGASDGLLTNILGGSCSLTSINVPVLAVGAVSGSQCNNGNTFCCPTGQDGNINPSLSCIPLDL